VGFYVASYAPYGYRKVKVTDGGRERPRLEIEDYQAQVVRRIFENVIKGKGLIDISKELNREGITAPRSNSWGKTTDATQDTDKRSLYGHFIVGSKQHPLILVT